MTFLAFLPRIAVKISSLCLKKKAISGTGDVFGEFLQAAGAWDGSDGIALLPRVAGPVRRACEVVARVIQWMD